MNSAALEQPSTNAAVLRRIGQICITVSDLDRAERFYRDLLGLKLLYRLPTMAFFDCGGVRLMLAIAEGEPSERCASIIYYVVDEIHEACRAIAARGVMLESPARKIAALETHDLWMAFLRDSEGNLVGLMCEMPADALSGPHATG
jgi:methylmalonyl-CoA/ethylmalonyl-CoA epimerase